MDEIAGVAGNVDAEVGGQVSQDDGQPVEGYGHRPADGQNDHHGMARSETGHSYYRIKFLTFVTAGRPRHATQTTLTSIPGIVPTLPASYMSWTETYNRPRPGRTATASTVSSACSTGR